MSPPLELPRRGHRWPGAIRSEIAGTIHSIITSELDALDIIARTGFHRCGSCKPPKAEAAE